MEVGDLVKMKYETWVKLNQTKHTTHEYGIVYGVVGKGLKVLMPSGKIQVGLIDHWEIVNG